MEPLRSIVYVSSATRPMSEADLEALLIEARRLNLESGTTGVLLYSGGNFMQCIEGHEDAMPATYQRIIASVKHRGIIELINEPVDERSFNSWQMGFKRAKESQLLALSTANWQLRAERAPDAESAGMRLLQTFWHQARN